MPWGSEGLSKDSEGPQTDIDNAKRRLHPVQPTLKPLDTKDQDEDIKGSKSACHMPKPLLPARLPPNVVVPLRKGDNISEDEGVEGFDDGSEKPNRFGLILPKSKSLGKKCRDEITKGFRAGNDEVLDIDPLKMPIFQPVEINPPKEVTQRLNNDTKLSRPFSLPSLVTHQFREKFRKTTKKGRDEDAKSTQNPNVGKVQDKKNKGQDKSTKG
ncbi:hypothetical protein B0J13DRAFT_517443 [Dactylonectria estremocensis]|uniref:Uncharacterized protein n=1 Tax=Dactylonectria estremocensis TaxID=1079267 RepID=A0A9P9FHV9_9HYPO|nr:hypothetical protein B0J13DRAFT_517443 [Dactylonectria estremocensis]